MPDAACDENPENGNKRDESGDFESHPSHSVFRECSASPQCHEATPCSKYYPQFLIVRHGFGWGSNTYRTNHTTLLRNGKKRCNTVCRDTLAVDASLPEIIATTEARGK